MRVLMLGWEFPPFITGGLGTACEGLTRALDRHGTEVIFLLPRAAGSEVAEPAPDHVTLLHPGTGPTLPPPAAGDPGGLGHEPGGGTRTGFHHARFLGIEAGFASPYERPGEAQRVGAGAWDPVRGAWITPEGLVDITESLADADWEAAGDDPPPAGYAGDLIDQVVRYARFCLQTARRLEFDVIHAHDWMTYPAGMWIARATGRPLIVHIHSTEFDRSGEHVNQRVYDIERRGVHAARRIIAVSRLTANVVANRYGVAREKIQVVYNGVEAQPHRDAGMTGIRSRDKIVLYFGRITYQKGPEYFIEAARRVLQYMEDVKFVVAGDGDQASRMIEMAAHLGIGHQVLFTGFLRGADIDRVFAMADLYVMPSRSEPFGIAPLEAMGHDVPVLISKSSGVSEVLTHALKVDFWDIDDMANKIIAVLRHPPLSRTLRQHGAMEVRHLTWDGAAERCERVYDEVVREMAAPALAGSGH